MQIINNYVNALINFKLHFAEQQNNKYAGHIIMKLTYCFYFLYKIVIIN